MLKEVSKEQWIQIISEKSTSVFDDPDYLELISRLHRTVIHYYVFYRQEKHLLGFAVHIKGNSIVVPDHYSYSSFWWSDTLTDFGFFEALDAALKDLRRFYKSFSFRLPPEVTDIRAFILNGCDAKVNYTYLLKTGKHKVYRANLSEKLKQAENYDFELVLGSNFEEVLDQQIKDFQIFGYTKNKTHFYQKYFEVLFENNFIKSYSLYLDHKLKASSIIIIDKKASKAYNLLHSTSKNNNHFQASAWLYQQIIINLFNSEIQTLDLYGADMKGIANFKSGFRGELKPHFTINYSAKRVYWIESLGRLKSFIKKFL